MHPDDGAGQTEHALKCASDHYALCMELARLYADVAVIESALGISVAGGRWYTGHGAPSDAIGVNGDLYLDRDTADVYEKENGTWF